MKNRTLLESDRQYVKDSVNKLIDNFFDDLKDLNNKLGEKEKLITKLEFNRTIMARAYAIKLGILKAK